MALINTVLFSVEKEGRKGRIISEVIEEKEAKVMYVVDVEPEDKTIGMDTFLPTRQPYAEEFSVLLRSYDIVQGQSSCPQKIIR